MVSNDNGDDKRENHGTKDKKLIVKSRLFDRPKRRVVMVFPLTHFLSTISV